MISTPSRPGAVVGAALLTAVALASVASPASAASQWTPYRQQDVTVTAARSTCAFDVEEKVLQDDERYRTIATYPDGTPKEQLFEGTLVMSFTNADTGASVVHDLSATAVFAYNPDGSPQSLTSRKGAFGATMPAGSTPQTGIFVLGGKGTSVTFDPDGTRSYSLGSGGTAISVCPEIG